MDRADPASMRIAASSSFAFMSFILTLAISRSCAVVTRPTGAPRPADDEAAWDLFSATLAALLPTMTMPAGATAEADASGLVGTSLDVRDLARGIWTAWRERATPAS